MNYWKYKFLDAKCPYSLFTCLALDHQRCLPILANGLGDWQDKAIERRDNCKYQGIELTQLEYDSRYTMNEDKASKLKIDAENLEQKKRLDNGNW